MDEHIDLKTFFQIVKKRIWTIWITMFFLIILIAIYSIYFYKPTYEATENIFIGNFANAEGRYMDPQELSMLIASTIDFIKSPVVLNHIQNQFNVSDEELEKKLVVQNNKNSQIINIVVRGNDVEITKNIAHEAATISINKIEDLFGAIEINRLGNGEPSIKQVGSLPLNIAIGLVIGLFFGIGIVLLREHLDDSIKDIKEVEINFGLPVLGEVNLKKVNSHYKRIGRTNSI